MLVDTEGLYFRANREILAAVGVTLDQAAYVELFLRTGQGAWHLAQARGFDDAAIAALRAARNRRYTELVAEADVLDLPGAREIVAALARRYRLAIVTSAEPEPFARTHARTGLLPFFEVVLTREQYRRSKPDPEPYLAAVARLDLTPGAVPGHRGLRARPARCPRRRHRMLGHPVGADRAANASRERPRSCPISPRPPRGCCRRGRAMSRCALVVALVLVAPSLSCAAGRTSVPVLILASPRRRRRAAAVAR